MKHKDRPHVPAVNPYDVLFRSYPCINCGEPGKHYVQPSLGELGFFTCKKI